MIREDDAGVRGEVGRVRGVGGKGDGVRGRTEAGWVKVKKGRGSRDEEGQGGIIREWETARKAKAGGWIRNWGQQQEGDSKEQEW